MPPSLLHNQAKMRPEEPVHESVANEDLSNSSKRSRRAPPQCHLLEANLTEKPAPDMGRLMFMPLNRGCKGTANMQPAVETVPTGISNNQVPSRSAEVKHFLEYLQIGLLGFLAFVEVDS